MTLKIRHTRSLVVVIAMEMTATSVSEDPLKRSGSSERQGKERRVPEIPDFNRPVLTAGPNHLPSLWKHTAVIFPLWPSKIATCKYVYPEIERDVCSSEIDQRTGRADGAVAI